MKNKSTQVNIFWFRRDLRLDDNHGFYQALNSGLPVQCIFIFDTNILEKLEDEYDARVHFIHDTLESLKTKIEAKGAALDVRYGDPIEIWKELVSDYDILNVFFNQDFEPYSKKRDDLVSTYLSSHDIGFQGSLDHLIFHPGEVLKDNSDPYVVFTPYSRVWKKSLFDKNGSDVSYEESSRFDAYPSQDQLDNLYMQSPMKMPTLKDMGFCESKIPIPPDEVKRNIIINYHKRRDYPAVEGTSRLGIHLRFGTISIRSVAKEGARLNETYLNELIWREFYTMILFHFPFVVERSFREKYDRIPWRNDPHEFQAWCDGKTGYPLVDAGIRQLVKTGYMHNRVRMVVASFLTKHLLIDWRWGAAFFARHLLDYELASNNGGWQWASGSGTDAAPYFRIFNPESQFKKFDPQRVYVHTWIPEFETNAYPGPIVDHKMARERCLKVFKEALG